MSILVPELDDLGLVREKLILKNGIFHILLDINIDIFKVSFPMYSFYENSGGKLPK